MLLLALTIIALFLLLAIMIGACIQGIELHGPEQKVQNFFMRFRAEEDAKQELYESAYRIVMDLGEALDEEDIIAQCDAVRSAHDRARAFRARAADHPVPMSSSVSRLSLKVVK
ncbi:hypothetical protein CWB99_06310 [Pseudoalteromonas rubra]|uniref:Uncharacterized protein n=1 Tax=Pseudoalteromonas rubra TaxID=43658 RepID=A0A5S3WPF9_9GAMM|nr:hypothetical protein [Pseudoalteromonas rubra]TMP30352.1 hypothetical protein CWB99_06310 [Pseudoalteromonas rubra]TMP35375.1 hypothetical protein CWC00_04370 [Pseudoalteromonas rubra]